MADRSLTGRADLARLVADQPGEDPARLGALLGFEVRSEPSEPSHPTLVSEPAAENDRPEPTSVEFTQGQTRPVPFWMPVRYERLKRPERSNQPPQSTETAPPQATNTESRSTDAAPLPVWRSPPADPPPWPPLRSWASLQGLLRALLTPNTDGPAIDVDRAIRDLSECRVLDRPPRKRMPAWTPRCVVVLDRDRRLVPLWRDQEMVLAALSHAAPHMTVTPVTWDPATGVYRSIAADGSETVDPRRDGTPWLVLGDLGAVTGGGPDPWIALARNLDPRCAIAVTPVPPDRLPSDLRTLWRLAPWEDTAPAPDDLDRRALARKLLVCLSPAFCFTPGMLRAMRREVLPEADALVECMAWNDPAVECLASVATALTPEAATALRAEFAGPKLTDGQRETALSVIRSWRTGGPATPVGEDYWFPEVLNLPPSARRCLPEPSDVEDARRYFVDLDRRRCGDGEPLSQQTRAWLSQMGDCAPQAFEQETAFRHVVWSVKAKEPGYTPPKGDLPPLEDQLDVGRVAVAHVGGSLALKTAPAGLGSPVTTLESGNGVVDIALDSIEDNFAEIDRRFPWCGPPGKADPLRPLRARVGSGREAWFPLTLPTFSIDDDSYWCRIDQALDDDLSWASATGRDHMGLWAEFRAEDVTQRLRWIPPGRFSMGSPEDKVGRRDNKGFWSDESPQHEVTLDQGFWLFDTPCTQALWQAVMGDNSSRFKSPDRPVETVSWGDVQTFLQRINDRVPGLDLTLPSEAQWEYACRANADPPSDLEAVAWYDENSEDQTHPVGQKQSNAWGLHDMLGNVEEWCADHWHDSYEGAPEDGSAWLEDIADTGADRVVRGGCWLYFAELMGAAYRRGDHPNDGFDYLGFRCSRVPVSPASGGAEPAEPSRQVEQEFEGSLARPLARPLAHPLSRRISRSGEELLKDKISLDRPGTESSPPIIEGRDREKTFVIRTDREQVFLEQRTRPPWAEAMGRDRFGLWTRIALEAAEGPPVTQRMRWIPPGRFLMGSPEDEPGRFEREGPQHEVTLANGFWLFDTPCTQALWQAVMGDNPSRYQSADRPVERVRWNDVRTFLTRINERIPGVDLTLPSEAQWEYACRAGEGPPPDLEAVAWYDKNSGGETHPVGEKQANAWGLHDMLGNVWEWCADHWHKTYDGAPADGTSWQDAGTGASRVGRGGSWSSNARHVRAAYRGRGLPAVRGDGLGFRCSRAHGRMDVRHSTDHCPGRLFAGAETKRPAACQ
ncbi:formylglycine-generating enzyme family protein [Rhodospira trueperi]|uniref:Formylglycine-generating enzyme, required for sulfatase activity, contains SUMF1/FGE domain n=1 Tax=Rhodospira trueperi TaxID=69960 RepID=A0A1G7IES2_9PROT|nr:formylglycine-generating enzyme family protein [Rhodospira trueperi]SDF11143.1 Formylglycine-generating enzyme, required for sulfatase activity, contains SUMF1/FGE domain [Rhodospira trueperi]